MKNKRPKLNIVDLKGAVNNLLGCKPGFFITMSKDQWDSFLEEGYFNQGATLIELDENKIPITAYRLV